jgi:hypothetical protein
MTALKDDRLEGSFWQSDTPDRRARLVDHHGRERPVLETLGRIL